MDKRDFLKQIAIASIGAPLLTTTWAHNLNQLEKTHSDKPTNLLQFARCRANQVDKIGMH